MEDKVITSFKKDFIAIKSKGFIVSHRGHNTGIGKTFEDLIGIVENNNLLVDYQDKLELKSSRELSNSMVTLFTKSPSSPPNANTFLRTHFGHPDPTSNNMMTLHTTISGKDFNTFFNKFGFKLHIDRKQNKIFILVKDLSTNIIQNVSIYYEFDELRNIVSQKCKYIAFISAKTKTVNGNEAFHFDDAIILSGMDFEQFIDFVEKGLIYYDIRMGVYKSGANRGKSHDHGSGFRIKKNDIPVVFKQEKIE